MFKEIYYKYKKTFALQFNKITNENFLQGTKAKIRKRIWTFIRSIFMIGLCFTILYPVIVNLSKIFMDKIDLFDNTVVLMPKHFTLENIVYAAKMMDFGQALKNTMILTISTSLLQTISCLLAGYGFARFDFKFKNVLFALVVFTIIVPPQLIMVSLFMNFQNFDIFGIMQAITGEKLNLLDSFTPSMLLSFGCMGIKNGLFIYIFRQFFKGMPKETEEAALVDGAGTFRIFYNIMVPNTITSIVTVLLFSFVWQYNDTIYTNLFLKNTPVLSLSYSALNSFSWRDINSSGDGITYLQSPEYISVIKSTGVLMMIAPVILVYMTLQKFFITGIERSGLVG